MLGNLLPSSSQTTKILSDKRFKEEDTDILDFLFESDCEGNMPHRTCKKIYDLIKDNDYTGKTFVYGAISDGNDYERLKEFLRECYSKRRKAYWR